jgi:hypothetical protein
LNDFDEIGRKRVRPTSMARRPSHVRHRSRAHVDVSTLVGFVVLGTARPFGGPALALGPRPLFAFFAQALLATLARVSLGTLALDRRDPRRARLDRLDEAHDARSLASARR